MMHFSLEILRGVVQHSWIGFGRPCEILLYFGVLVLCTILEGDAKNERPEE